MGREALAVKIGDLQGEGCMEPEAQAIDRGEGDLVVQGGGGREEPSDRLHTEDGGETVCGLSAHERQSGPVTRQDVRRAAADAAGAEAHRSRGEAIDVFPGPAGVLQFLFRDAVRGCVVERREQAYFADRGLWGTFACAAELERCNHVLP
jgi:hypothetical protein